MGLFFSAPAKAESLFLAGGNASGADSHYAYIGSIIPFADRLSDQGFRVRLWASYLGFEYDKTPTTEIEADGPGVEGAIGYLWKLDQTSISGYLGAVYRDIDLDPDDPASDTEDDDLGGKVQLEVNHKFDSAWNANVIGSYTFAIDSYWVRFRPGYRMANNLTIGPSFTMLGGERFDKQKLGLFVQGLKLGNLSLGVEAGAERKARKDDIDAFGGLSVSFTY